MAQFINMYPVDLMDGPAIVSLRQMHAGNANANRVGAIVMEKHENVELSGQCVGRAIRADGTTVPLTGKVSGNQAYVELTADCYAVEGVIKIYVTAVDGDNKITLVAAVGNVQRTETDAIIQPADPIPDLDDLLAEIANMREAAADARTATKQLRLFNVSPLDIEYSYENTTRNGVTFTWADGICHAVGTATAEAFSRAYWANSALPAGMAVGGEYYGAVQSTDEHLTIDLYASYDNGADWKLMARLPDGVTAFTVPVGVTGLIIRANVSRGATVDATISFAIADTPPNAVLDEKLSRLIQPKDASAYINTARNTLTLSDIKEDGRYIISDSVTVPDAPAGLRVTGLTVERFRIDASSRGFTKQTAESVTGPNNYHRYFRIANSAGVYGDWIDLSDCLPATGDRADRAASIAALLENSGICRLGPGTFYVSGIAMPAGATLSGCGAATKIVLLPDGAAYAVKMNSNCTVRDLEIQGADGDITLPGAVGDRHGILWQGDASVNGSASANLPLRGTVTNCRIRRFTGGGITCENTGYGNSSCLNVTDCYIYNCFAGVNISYFSEFHRFTNVHAIACAVGCVNNGGNNTFVNCGFSGNQTGMLMDNASGQSPNNSHGSAIGCVFNHSGGNSGTGVKIIGCENGFMFAGGQMFYSRIELENASGVVFSEFNFGSGETISVSGGGEIVFAHCMFGAAPIFQIADNDHVRVTGCYTRSGAAVMLPGDSGVATKDELAVLSATVDEHTEKIGRALLVDEDGYFYIEDVEEE